MARALIRQAAVEEILEIVDGFRKPLADRRLEGESLTNSENELLTFLDNLTDYILQLECPEPKQDEEVTQALEQACKLAQSIQKK